MSVTIACQQVSKFEVELLQQQRFMLSYPRCHQPIGGLVRYFTSRAVCEFRPFT